MWIVDIRDETNPTPVSAWFPEREKYFNRGGCFGAHNIQKRLTDTGPWAKHAIGTLFYHATLAPIATTRTFDISPVRKCRAKGKS